MLSAQDSTSHSPWVCYDRPASSHGRLKPAESCADPNALLTPREEREDNERPANPEEHPAPDAADSAVQNLKHFFGRILTSASVGNFLIFVASVCLFTGVIHFSLTRSLEVLASAQETKDASVTGDGGGSASPTDTESAKKGQSDGTHFFWRITGRVLDAGAPVEDVVVWAVAYDEAGNTYSPAAKNTNAEGEFAFDPIPSALTLRTPARFIRSIKVFARQEPAFRGLAPREGEATLSVVRDSTALLLSEMNISFWHLIPLACFVATLLCVSSFSKHGYYGALWLTLALSLAVFVGNGIRTFNTSVLHGQFRTMGFVSFFEGTYIEDAAPEWLMSLTAPPTADVVPSPPSAKSPAGNAAQPAANGAQPAASDGALVDQGRNPIARGLGAPIWVVFVSVLGAALLTLVLVVQGFSNPPKLENLGDAETTELRKRHAVILEHQAFVFFSPLGGILVYQLLMLGGAAKEPVTVAIVILGAGATLNGLLAKAVRLAQDWAQGNQTR